MLNSDAQLENRTTFNFHKIKAGKQRFIAKSEKDTETFLKKLHKLLKLNLFGFNVSSLEDEDEIQDNVLRLLITKTNEKGHTSAFVSEYAKVGDGAHVSFKPVKKEGWNTCANSFKNALVEHIVIASEKVSEISNGELVPNIETISFSDNEEYNKNFRIEVIHNLREAGIKTIAIGKYSANTEEVSKWLSSGKTLEQWKERYNRASVITRHNNNSTVKLEN